MRRVLVAAVAATLLAFTPTATAAPGGGHGGGGGGGGGGKTSVVSTVAPTATTNENGSRTIQIGLSRANNLKCPASVTYTVTPTSSSDITDANSGIRQFAANVSTASITLNVVNDGLAEADEVYTVTLTGASVNQTAKGCKGITGAVSSTANQTAVTITDSDVNFQVAPSGGTLVLHNMSLGSCNSVTAFYEVDGARTDIATYDVVDCFGTPAAQPSDITVVNSTGVAKSVRLGIEDNDCHRTYFSDTTGLDDIDGTTTTNHASVLPFSIQHWQVDLSDAQATPDCSAADTDRVHAPGEFTATVIVPPAERSGTITIPGGKQARIAATLAGCDHLIAVWEIPGDGTSTTTILESQGGCDPLSNTVTAVNPSTTDPMSIQLVLLDTTCVDGIYTATYLSDGSGTADHATVRNEDPIVVDIADGGSGCGNYSATVDPLFGTGNLHAEITIENAP